MNSFSIGSKVWPGLSKLIEETGEVQQVAGKIIGVHGATIHFDGSDLRNRLEEELADLQAAIAFVVTENALDNEAILNRAALKLVQFRKWNKKHNSTAQTYKEILAKALISHGDSCVNKLIAYAWTLDRDGSWTRHDVAEYGCARAGTVVPLGTSYRGSYRGLVYRGFSENFDTLEEAKQDIDENLIAAGWILLDTATCPEELLDNE